MFDRSIGGFLKNVTTKRFSVRGMMDMAGRVTGGGNSALSKSLTRVTGLIGRVQNLTSNPPLATLKSMAMGGIGRVLSSRGVMSALPPGLGDIIGGIGGGLGTDLPSFGQGCSSSGLSLGSGLNSLVNVGLEKLGSSLGTAGLSFVTDMTSSILTHIGGKAGMMAGLRSSACTSK